nr:hypothetical protein [Tanacetum cinerariifolium]
MVNTRTNADLSAAVQIVLQTLLPQIHAKIHEEFRTSSGPSDAGKELSVGSSQVYPLSSHVSTLNHLMCMSYTDVAQVANAARNYEILHERDDDDAKRPDKRQKSGDRHQPTSQQSSHRNHGHNNDRHGSDRRGGSDNHRNSNNNYSGRVSIMDVTSETGVSSPTDMPILVLNSPGVPLRATPTQFALRVDADTQESVVELL